MGVAGAVGLLGGDHAGRQAVSHVRQVPDHAQTQLPDTAGRTVRAEQFPVFHIGERGVSVRTADPAGGCKRCPQRKQDTRSDFAGGVLRRADTVSEGLLRDAAVPSACPRCEADRHHKSRQSGTLAEKRIHRPTRGAGYACRAFFAGRQHHAGSAVCDRCQGRVYRRILQPIHSGGVVSGGGHCLSPV